jgi:hypothetical protein
MNLETRLVEDVISLKKDVKEIRECLLGDRIAGRPGLIQLIEDIRREIYGDSSRHQIGLIERQSELQQILEALERQREAIRWMAVGWAGAISLILSIVSYWIRHFLGK